MKTMGAYEQFEEHEYVTALSQAKLDLQKKGHVRRTFDFVAVGTAFQKGEESACRGKVYIFAVEKKRDQRPRVANLEKLFDQKQFGPVTAISTVSGLLALCIGPKVLQFSSNC
ncbi:hypothetical protein MHBO_004771 [Bonamia ostreae]|uniref:RSE1/DDB1/CPSF1 C-terminal domain-containing protein n=1 Tax=Bonamia ostreae TaxID=126728 RepID=A0ABV2AU85_9EUKA